MLATAEPQTFDALVLKACNVERQIARRKMVSQKFRAQSKRTDDKDKEESMAAFTETTKSKKVAKEMKLQKF